MRTKTSPRKTRAIYKRRTTNNACNTHSTTLSFITRFSATFRACIKSAIRNKIIAKHWIHSTIATMTEKGTKSHRSSVLRRIDTRSDRRYPIERAPRSPQRPSTTSPRSPRPLLRFPGFPIANRDRERRDRLEISEGRRLG